MGALEKKLTRDLWQMRSQVVAIVAVVAAGVAVFYAAMGVYDSLRAAQAEYYERCRLPHVFARVVRAPRSVAAEIEGFPGVAAVRARTVTDVAADVPGVAEPAVLRVVTMPREGTIGGVLIRRGTPPIGPDEILINEVFAEATHLEFGAELTATIHGQHRVLRVVGVGMSPEFLFQMRGMELLPDNRRFGVVWMEEAALAAQADMAGAFNDLAVELAPGADQAALIARLDDLLAPYGTLGAQDRRDGLLSHRFISDELDQLRASARMVPAIFLGVAAFLLNVILGRVVATQRAIIGTLKAFGVSSLRVGLHYLELCLFVVLLGSALGAGLGAWLGAGMTDLYQPYYRFPALAFRPDPTTLVIAVGLAVVSGSVGAVSAVRRAVALPPAEAMRPEAPPAFRATAFDRPALRRMLSTVARMVVRNLLRRPVRTGLSVVGVALAAAIVVLVGGMGDSLDVVTDVQFHEVQRSDATVLFAEARSTATARSLARLPGVLRAEPFRAVPVTLHAGHLRYRTALMGIPGDGELRGVVGEDRRALPVPDEGMIVSRVIADKLGVAAGDALLVELLEGSRRTRPARVVAVVDDMMGASATMEIGAVDRLVGGPPLSSGVELRVDERRAPQVLAALRRAGGVASVTLRSTALASFREALSQNLEVMQRVEVIFAFVIAFAVVYNGARTSLSERSRELATLRVLGFSTVEVAAVLLGELGVITLVAIPGGLVLGYFMTHAIMDASSNDLFRLPFVVAPASSSTAALVIIVSAVVSAVVVAARVRRLDLVGVLKTRD